MKRLYNVNTGKSFGIEKDTIGDHIVLPNNVKHYYLTTTKAHNAAAVGVTAGSRMTDASGNDFVARLDGTMKWKLLTQTA